MFGFNMFHDVGRPFNNQYKCFSVALLPGNERSDVERGGKIIMPSSALDQLTRLNIVYPMLFKLTNKKTKRETHSGVLEFVADEGKVYLPFWMMRNLMMNEGDLIQVESVSLPVATFSKFQPSSPEFLDISNPKAVLENTLRNFACLTTGDVIAIKYNDKTFELTVLETKPGKAISVIECDMNVDFAAPVGYQEPKWSRQGDSKSGASGQGGQEEEEELPAEMNIDPSEYDDKSGFKAFSGAGTRLDGRKNRSGASECASEAGGAETGNAAGGGAPPVRQRGIPWMDYKPGKLIFVRKRPPKATGGEAEEKSEFSAFSGQGQSLRNKGK